MVALVAVLLVALVLGRRGVRVPGLVNLSHLKCGKCGVEFDYRWVPGTSFTSVRLGTSRYMRCPNCHRWSTFNVWKTRVDPRTHHCEIVVGPS